MYGIIDSLIGILVCINGKGELKSTMHSLFSAFVVIYMGANSSSFCCLNFPAKMNCPSAL